MPKFLPAVWAVLAMVAGFGCGAGGGGHARSADRDVPRNCDAEKTAAATARGVGGPGAAEAVLALADCRAARWEGAAGETAEVSKLYDEAGSLAPGKWPIGAQVHKASFLKDCGGSDARKANDAYEAALSRADEAAPDVRMDVEVADWVKTACAATRSGQKSKHTVCRPWGGSWR